MPLCLLPKKRRTREGKQHVTAASLKSFSAKNLKHQSHPCTKFARATINALEELAWLLGPGDVTFHSHDDKAIVPIGLMAASK